MSYVVGIDLGGTNSKIGIVNEKGEILNSSIIKTQSEDGMKKCFNRIWKEVLRLCESMGLKKEEINGIGMGIPGPVEKGRIVGFFSNFPWEKGINVKDVIKEITGVENVMLDNDANVIALGEGRFGLGIGSNLSVTVTIGTGIGGGICSNGTLISGFKGAAGEFGHIKLVKDGKKCGCGQNGCFEAYASATGLINEAKERIKNRKESLIYKIVDGNIEKIQGKDIFDAGKKGDKLALELIDYEGEYLAMGLGNILNMINPEILILGGGIAQAGEILLNAVKEKLPKYALPIVLEGIKIVISELKDEAGILGAAALVMEN